MVWRTSAYHGWGRALRAEGEIARPERMSALTALPTAPAMGMRRSYGDACLNDAGRIVDMSRLDRILEFDAETGLLHAEAGLTIGEIVCLFAPRGWLPPVISGTGFATLGGAIANDVHGKNHHSAGSFGQHVREITLIQGGGARVVKEGSTLFRATIGGLGQTGVIASAMLTLKPIKGRVMRVREQRVADFESFIAAFDESSAPYSVGWIDATAKGSALGRGIFEEGQIAEGTPPKAKAAKKVPIDAPGFALSSPVVRLFNGAYLRRVPVSGRTVKRSFEDFFFPLDRIHDWNRLYGKKGFHQFQCVVPIDASGALKDMLAHIARAGRASPLAVLKKMGPGRAGMMSFPGEGLTLAVDLRAGSEALVQELNAKTLEAGGRIYLAKDALADAATIAAMYPERAAWAAEATKADPEGHLSTDLVRRLKLREIA